MSFQCVHFSSFKVTCVGADFHFILCQHLNLVEHLPLELCALVRHECVDNWDMGTRAWVEYHDDKTLIKRMRCAWINGCVNKDVDTSIEKSQKFRVRKHHCSHVGVLLVRVRETHRSLEKRPVLIGHFVVIRSVLNCTNCVA